MEAVHISKGGPDLLILVDGMQQLFEDHPHCGPVPVKPGGSARSLGPRHKFWHAVTCWYEQGKKIGADGLCLWEEPPDPTAGMVKIGRHYFPPAMLERLRARRAESQ